MKTTLRNLILGLVLFVILLILIGNNLLRVISETSCNCQSIIVANTKKPDLFSKEGDVFVENCRPDFVQISEDRIKINGYIERVRIGSAFKNYFEFRDLEEAVYYVFANELYDCWKLALEGKADLGKNNGLLCSRISFTDSLKNKDLTFDGLFDYLYTYNIPGKDLPYSTYLLRKRSICKYKSAFYLGVSTYGVSFNLASSEPEEDIVPLFVNYTLYPTYTSFKSYSSKDDFKIDSSKNYYVLFLTLGEDSDVKDCSYPLRSFLFLVDETGLGYLLPYPAIVLN